MLVLAATYAAEESVVSAELDGETVLLNVQSGIYFGLDAIGSEIWKMVEPGATEEHIVQRLAADYDVEINKLRADIREFLDLLLTKGLVREVTD